VIGFIVYSVYSTISYYTYC